MSEYHTVLLTSAGQVYTCGHGRGGRLGHPNEQTCLVSTPLHSLTLSVTRIEIYEICIFCQDVLSDANGSGFCLKVAKNISHSDFDKEFGCKSISAVLHILANQ